MPEVGTSPAPRPEASRLRAGRISCRTSRRADWPHHSPGKLLRDATRIPRKTPRRRGSRTDTGNTSCSWSSEHLRVGEFRYVRWRGTGTHGQASGDQGSSCRDRWGSGNARAGAGRWPPSQPLRGEAWRGARFQLVKCLQERGRRANRVGGHRVTARLVTDQRDDLVAVRWIVDAADPRWIGGRGRRDDRDQGKDHRDEDDPPSSRQGGSRSRSLPLRGWDGQV